MKKIFFVFTLTLIPTTSFATSISSGGQSAFLFLGMLDEILLFLILPLLVLVLIIKIYGYKNTNLLDPIRQKRKRGIRRTILWIIVFFALWLVLPKQPASEGCGFNMMESCPVTFRETLSRFGIGKPDLSKIQCPPNMHAAAQKGKSVCLPN